MKLTISKNIAFAGALGLCLAAPLAVATPAQAAPERDQGGGSTRGFSAPRAAAPQRNFAPARTAEPGASRGGNFHPGGFFGGGNGQVGVVVRGGGSRGGGGGHDSGDWNGRDDRGGFGLSLNLGSTGYYAPGYYAAPVYVAPVGVYVRFGGTVQGIDTENGFLGILADNGSHFDVQVGANAVNYGSGERVFVTGTAIGSTVQPTGIRPL